MRLKAFRGEDDPHMLITPATADRGGCTATQGRHASIIDDEPALVGPDIEKGHSMSVLSRCAPQTSL
jgi:hypothetical protein